VTCITYGPTRVQQKIVKERNYAISYNACDCIKTIGVVLR